MIARSWHGAVPEAKADEYHEYLLKTGVPDLEGTLGNHGVYLFRRITYCSERANSRHSIPNPRVRSRFKNSCRLRGRSGLLREGLLPILTYSPSFTCDLANA